VDIKVAPWARKDLEALQFSWFGWSNCGSTRDDEHQPDAIAGLRSQSEQIHGFVEETDKPLDLHRRHVTWHM